jgi:Transcriptional regulator, AbiEi antitoxin
LSAPLGVGKVDSRMGDTTRQIIEHASAHGGIISTREAQALGMNRMTISRRVESGILVRIGRGLLALPGPNSDGDLDLEAACRRLNAVVSHESAGEMHQFDGLGWAPPTVTVPHRLTHEFPGVRVHQSTDLSDDDVMRVQGLPVTTPERTIIDLAAVMGDARLDFVLDRALSSGTIDLARLGEVFAGLGRRGKPGTARIRRMLEKRDASYVPPDTVLEQRLMDLIVEFGLPRPIPQFRPAWLAPTNGRVDLAYPDHKVIIEGDSRKWHLLMKSFEIDRGRDNQAQLAGWRIFRFTWQAIIERPEEVAATIRAALGV